MDCGGCEGLGSHKRWCAAVVGDTAAMLGRYAERLEGMGDSIGIPTLASSLWGLASAFRTEAYKAGAEWQAES